MVELFYFFRTGLWHNPKYLKGYFKRNGAIWLLYFGVLTLLGCMSSIFKSANNWGHLDMSGVLFMIFLVGGLVVVLCVHSETFLWKSGGAGVRYIFFPTELSSWNDEDLVSGFFVAVKKERGPVRAEEVTDFKTFFLDDGQEVFLICKLNGDYFYYSAKMADGYKLGKQCWRGRPLYVLNNILNVLTADGFFPVGFSGKAIVLGADVQLRTGRTPVRVVNCRTNESVELGDLPEIYLQADELLYMLLEQKPQVWQLLQVAIGSWQRMALNVMAVYGLKEVTVMPESAETKLYPNPLVVDESIKKVEWREALFGYKEGS